MGDKQHHGESQRPRPAETPYAEDGIYDIVGGRGSHPRLTWNLSSTLELEESSIPVSLSDHAKVEGIHHSIAGGNHAYAKQYRDQMTHRNSPNISTLSPFSTGLRDPAIFALKRITEDYLKAIEFIQGAVDEVAAYLSTHPIFETSEQRTENKICRQ